MTEITQSTERKTTNTIVLDRDQLLDFLNSSRYHNSIPANALIVNEYIDPDWSSNPYNKNANKNPPMYSHEIEKIKITWTVISNE